MMKINKDSWHYKMSRSSFGSYESRPNETDLCRYCHRVFWALFLRVLMIVMFSAVLIGLLYGVIWIGLIHNTLLTLSILGGAIALGTPVYFYLRWFEGSVPSEPKTLVGKYVQASKDKVCPLIEFED